MTDARSTLERRGISTARPRLARLVAALAVTSLASTLLVVVPTLPSAAAPGEGLRLVGIIPDDEPNVGTDAEGAYLIDPVSRVVFQYYKGTSPQNTTRLMFRAMDIDEFSNGKAQRKGFDLTIDQQQVPTLAQAAGTDITRTKIDIAGREPVVTLDTKNGRLFYAAGGAMYEVDYDFAAQTQTLAKWVAPPHLGQTVPEDQLYTPSGATSPTGDETYQPSFGLAYDDSTSSPMLYQVGQIKLKDAPDASLRSLWIAGWDASPGNPAASPQLRERWFYVTQTCRNLGRDQNTEVQTPVFRDGEWLYTFCSGSTDGSARGVLRVRIDPITGPIAGTEQFFPGVTGGDTNAWADPGKARVYILTLNSKAHARSVLVFDGRASNGQGAYIGAFSVANSDDGRRDPGPAMGAVNPLTHRWYFQSDTGAWLQEGGLRRVAQPERKVSAIATSVPEIDGRQECGKRNAAHPDPCGLKFVVRRPIRVDPGTSGRRTRIFVEQERAFCSRFVANLDNCIAVYEDGFSSVGVQSTVAENTLNVPETAGLVGSYSGIGTAFGVRTRILRGFSTVWPGGVGNQTIEGDPTGNPNSVTWYATDPFFYHGGDCGANDRELVVGRIFQTALTGGLQRNMARAGALGV
ncbi:MAG TPA: hypothetical protein VI916_11825, partial [Acidimicrobiia bacterium]|nr:hypothetical protein [Acidimicrobiia bacterium]